MIPADRRLAIWAAGTRADNRDTRRNAVDTDVEEGADDGTEYKRERQWQQKLHRHQNHHLTTIASIKTDSQLRGEIQKIATLIKKSLY